MTSLEAGLSGDARGDAAGQHASRLALVVDSDIGLPFGAALAEIPALDHDPEVEPPGNVDGGTVGAIDDLLAATGVGDDDFGAGPLIGFSMTDGAL